MSRQTTEKFYDKFKLYISIQCLEREAFYAYK